jgi:hypothetical protein
MNVPVAARLWCALALGATIVVPAGAATIEGNLDLVIFKRERMDAPLDAGFSLDPVRAAILGSERLGTWLGTSVEASNLAYVIAPAIDDPGVTTPPTDDRAVANYTMSVQVDGSLQRDPLTVNPTMRFVCPAPSTQCSQLASYTPVLQFPTPQPGLAAVGDVQGEWRFRAAAPVFEALFPGATPRLGEVPPTNALLGFTFSYHEVDGRLRFRSTFASKSSPTYVADAIAATVTTAQGGYAAHLTAAATDIAALRTFSSDSALQSGNQGAAANDELLEAHAVLAAGRDAALMQAQGASAGGSLNTRFELVRQLWNLTAAANPDLGRGQPGVAADPTFFADVRDEVATVRAALESTDATGFAASFERYAADGAVVPGLSPQFTLDGGLYGLDGALLQVYLMPGAGDGLQQLQLLAAERHMVWKSAFQNNLSLLEGIVEVDGAQLLATAGDSIYIGESERLLELETFGDAATVTLDNFYSPQTLVIASFGLAAPVPEPASGALLVGGLAVLVGRGRRRLFRRG